MDTLEENITVAEMLEKIAELDHKKSQLKDLNTEMRIWLDAADDEIATLRSENTSLKKQVKELEKMLCDAQDVEPEPTECQPDYLALEISNEIKMKKTEKESIILKEENEKLTAEVAEIRNLQQLQQHDDVTLNKLRASLQTLESEMEVTQLGLQQRDEVIQQKFQELKHAEEMMEEYSTIIKDLRLKNQQLKEELEAGQEEISFAVAIDLLGAKKSGSTPVLSFAEELRLLNSSVQVDNSMTDVTPRRGKAESENLLKTQCLVKHRPSESVDEMDSLDKCTSVACTKEPKLHLDVETRTLASSKHFKCAVILMTIIQTVILFLGTLCLLFLLAFVISGSLTGNSRLFSLNTLWNSAHLMLKPYCTLQYEGKQRNARQNTVAVFDFNKSHLKDLNSEMWSWLDADMTTLAQRASDKKKSE